MRDKSASDASEVISAGVAGNNNDTTAGPSPCKRARAHPAAASDVAKKHTQGVLFGSQAAEDEEERGQMEEEAVAAAAVAGENDEQQQVSAMQIVDVALPPVQVMMRAAAKRWKAGLKERPNPGKDASNIQDTDMSEVSGASKAWASGVLSIYA
jgi:hypothetical protein